MSGHTSSISRSDLLADYARLLPSMQATTNPKHIWEICLEIRRNGSRWVQDLCFHHETAGIFYPINPNYRPVIVTSLGDMTLVLKERLGEGANKKIRKAVHFQTGNPCVVAKIKNDSPEHFACIRRASSYVQGHPRFLQLLGTVRYRNKQGIGRFALLFEHCSLGSFYQCHWGHSLFPSERLEVFRQAVEGIVWLHSRNFVHRDLTWKNLLVHEKVAAWVEAKWGDPDSICSDIDSNAKAQHCTTFRLISPEYAKAFRDRELATLSHKKSDVWALGVLFWNVITGNCLPSGNTEEEVCQHLLQMSAEGVTHYPIPDSFDSRVKQILEKTFQFDPQMRCSAASLLDSFNALFPPRKSLMSNSRSLR